MTLSESVISVYQRILAITWQPDDSQIDIHIALMHEYLRRSSLWAKALNCNGRVTPFFDIADRVAPDVRAEPEIVEALLRHLKQIPLNGLVQRTCEWALHWAAISDTSQVKQLTLPEPYEPLLVLLERGGTFRRETGWIDIVGHGIATLNWLDYAERLPFVETDELEKRDRPSRS
ncbi:hypothetical protein [Pantanalinema sp. GBBB05]|uniref:hypothetical protein n=1 Tax=Pantanalinema sp. GBBB05 TaxID=2604139 RepID=UPI001E06C6C7|nr:hypothetical protein [Pantanalinema sp. GBBB05]